MHGTKRVNPLNLNALTADDVTSGDRIICWQPGVSDSTRHLRLASSVYTDDEGYMILDVEDGNGCVTTEFTSAVGLTCDAHSGQWTVIAIPNEEVD